MGDLLKACLYNVDRASSAEFHSHIGAVNFVRLVNEADTPEGLAATLADGAVNLVFFHLDPNPGAVIEIIDEVSSRFPEIAMIALSHETGPEAILAPIRAGCDQFVCEPIEQAELAAAVGRVASKRFLRQGRSRCVCVTGATGGAGATSIACNLAMEIAHLTDAKCALVDLNLQFGDIALNFDCDVKYTVFDLAQAGVDFDRTTVESVLNELPCNVSLLARPEMIEQQEVVTADTIHHTIALLTSMFESIVVDVPRRLDACAFAAVSQADVVLIVCQLLVPSIRNARRYYDALVRGGIPPERVEIVVNRAGCTGGRITQEDLEETTDKPIFASIPNDYEFVTRSLDFGRPIASLDRRNAVRAAIREIARKIVGDSSPEADDGAVRRGFLSRLLSK